MRGKREAIDAHFFDDELEAKVHAAFDEVEPSPEAADRMLQNLLTREAELGFFSEGPSVQPAPKRRIRPWQIAVPAAAAVLVLAAVLVAGPVLGLLPFGAPAAHNAEISSVSSAEEAEKSAEMAAESSSSAAQDSSMNNASSSSGASSQGVSSASGAAAASASSSASISSAEDAAGASDSISSAAESAEFSATQDDAEAVEGAEPAAADEAATEDTAAEETDQADETEPPENYAEDYPDIVVVIDGVEYQLKIDSTTAAKANEVGEFAYDATAYDEEQTASISCAIYESASESSDTYYISYLDEDTYYPALVV